MFVSIEGDRNFYYVDVLLILYYVYRFCVFYCSWEIGFGSFFFRKGKFYGLLV